MWRILAFVGNPQKMEEDEDETTEFCPGYDGAEKHGS